jgi:hypothetical protein
LEFDALVVDFDGVDGGLRVVLGLVDEVFAIVDDIGIGGDDLVGDDAVVGGVEVEQLLRLRLAGLNRDVNLAGACRLSHPLFILPINISQHTPSTPYLPTLRLSPIISAPTTTPDSHLFITVSLPLPSGRGSYL